MAEERLQMSAKEIGGFFFVYTGVEGGISELFHLDRSETFDTWQIEEGETCHVIAVDIFMI